MKTPRIGIRREDKNEWEARVPLIPKHVAQIVRHHGIDVTVQPSKIRAFPDQEYEAAGAEISEDLSGCDVVFAVKEIPVEQFVPGKTYIFFSHTIKGQKSNMPMLKLLMDRGCQLIDYEKITDHVGRRLIFFGRYAGLVGMINSLWALGRRLKHEGFDTPFSELRQTYTYDDLNAARKEIVRVGGRIEKEGLPAELGPLVVGFAGYGNVGRGAQEIFDLLPFKRIAPGDLKPLMTSNGPPANLLYKLVFKEEDMVEPVDPDHVFVLQDYYDRPERYRSKFEKYLPHLAVLVNAIYWDERYPRFVTQDYLEQAHETGGLRLKVIGDVTCDVGGSIECNLRSTDTGNPVYVYDPSARTATDGVQGRGVVVLATDNLPCELPKESSTAFSEVLIKFVPAIALADISGRVEESGVPDEIERAVIVWRGKLTKDFENLRSHV